MQRADFGVGLADRGQDYYCALVAEGAAAAYVDLASFDLAYSPAKVYFFVD